MASGHEPGKSLSGRYYGGCEGGRQEESDDSGGAGVEGARDATAIVSRLPLTTPPEWYPQQTCRATNMFPPSTDTPIVFRMSLTTYFYVRMIPTEL